MQQIFARLAGCKRFHFGQTKNWKRKILTAWGNFWNKVSDVRKFQVKGGSTCMKPWNDILCSFTKTRDWKDNSWNRSDDYTKQKICQHKWRFACATDWPVPNFASKKSVWHLQVVHAQLFGKAAADVSWPDVCWNATATKTFIVQKSLCVNVRTRVHMVENSVWGLFLVWTPQSKVYERNLRPIDWGCVNDENYSASGHPGCVGSFVINSTRKHCRAAAILKVASKVMYLLTHTWTEQLPKLLPNTDDTHRATTPRQRAAENIDSFSPSLVHLWMCVWRPYCTWFGPNTLSARRRPAELSTLQTAQWSTPRSAAAACSALPKNWSQKINNFSANNTAYVRPPRAKKRLSRFLFDLKARNSRYFRWSRQGGGDRNQKRLNMGTNEKLLQKWNWLLQHIHVSDNNDTLFCMRFKIDLHPKNCSFVWSALGRWIIFASSGWSVKV